MRLRDRAAQSVHGTWHQNQVYVIRHQAIGPHPGHAAYTGGSHQTPVLAIVVVAEKGLLAAIAALRDMMGAARNNDPSDSGQCDSPRDGWVRDKNTVLGTPVPGTQEPSEISKLSSELNGRSPA